MIRRLRLAGVPMPEIGRRCDPPISRQRVFQIWEVEATEADMRALKEMDMDRAQRAVDELARRAGGRARIAREARARVIDGMQEWNRIFGEPPAALDWQVQNAARKSQRRRERYASTGREWPNTTTVQFLFGSWNAAMKAAGFEPRAPGNRRGWSYAAEELRHGPEDSRDEESGAGG